MKHWQKSLLLWSGFALAVTLVAWVVRGGDTWRAELRIMDGRQELTIGREGEVYYTIQMPASSGAGSYYLLKPGAVNAPGWKETFYDGSALPGRWTLTYGTHEIDVMRSSVVVNKKSYAKGTVIYKN